jgi:hypothetical protein
MAATLVQQLQQNLGIPPIQKIDPNTQAVKTSDESVEKHTVEQAALPAVLAGLYKYSTTDVGSQTISSGNCDDWTSSMYGEKEQDIIAHVADYAGVSTNEAHDKMEHIASEAVAIINQNAKSESGSTGLKDYLLSQRRDILTYLPAELHAGEMLNDNTIDDRTNKMEGPMSSFMQKLGNLFTSSEGPAENKTSFK